MALACQRFFPSHGQNLECGALHRFGSNVVGVSPCEGCSYIPFARIQSGGNRRTPNTPHPIRKVKDRSHIIQVALACQRFFPPHGKNLECGALHRFGSNDVCVSSCKGCSDIPFTYDPKRRNRRPAKSLPTGTSALPRASHSENKRQCRYCSNKIT